MAVQESPTGESHPDALMHAIQTAAAVRRFDDREVPRNLLVELVRAATCAPSPRNTQPWEFVVVVDPGVRGQIAEALEPRARSLDEQVTGLPDGEQRGLFQAGARLIRSLGQAPALVFVCGREVDLGPTLDDREMLLSALYTGAQNLRIAARAHGLGSAFTTLHVHAEAEIRRALSLDEDDTIGVTVPVGWPARPQRLVRRRPVDEVSRWI